ncbi:DnaB-like helicase C-terminal domain-containing protein, partial [Sphingomonas panaciterrae]|uniref:DnaB-like helicase C-terminal domain-containing protein n=1 Tax=Sphingomonas panaciterrae TaxID=1462999 RepID=UPI002FF3E329
RGVDRVADLLTQDDFYEQAHGRIYAAIVGEVQAGRRANPILLRPLLEHDAGLAELGGPSYLAQLTGSGAGLIGTVDFAKQIADLSKRRRLVTRLGELIEASRDSARIGTPIESLVDTIDQAMTEALQRDHVSKGVSFDRAFDNTLKAIEAEARGDAPTGLAVHGLDDWNELTGTMRRGEVVILAGRPSMGKTAVGLSAALASARAGHGTLFVSLEMSVEELTKRAITDTIFDYGQSASYENVQRGKFTAFDRDRIGEIRRQIDSWPLIFHEDAGLRIGRLAMMIRRYRRQMAGKGKTLDVVFIDYLGLVRGDSSKQKRYEEVSEVSRTIKTLARELNVAIVLLAQLNREVEKREDKRPQLSDLRDSGEIEQDADTVLFVYREQYYLERSEPDQHDDRKRAAWETAMDACRDRVELISAKVRKGRIGRRNCYFFASHQAVRGSAFFSSGRR